MNRSISGKYVAVGQVTSCHGLTGMVKVRPLTGLPERLQKLRKVLVKGPSLDYPRVFTVERVLPLGRLWAVKLARLDSREAAVALVGGLLLIPHRKRASLPEGAFYVDQVIGLTVRDEAGARLGQVVGVLPTCGHDLYVIRSGTGETVPNCDSTGCPGKHRDQGGEWLLPAVKDLVLEVNLADGFMIVRLPEGLIGL